MSLYSEYLHEMGWGLVESPRGFATYRITGPECYIQDVYVQPEHRKEKVATYMWDVIAARARAQGCTRLICTVDPTNPGWLGRKEFITKYGFKTVTETQQYIAFQKDL